MKLEEKGFVTVLTGLYPIQDCVHFLASVRKFHQERIVIFSDRVPTVFKPILKSFKNVTFKQAPANINPVLSSRLAKVNSYWESPFQKTLCLDCDICLLGNISEAFDYLDEVDLLVTQDVQPQIHKAWRHLLREEGEVIPTLQSIGIPLQQDSIHYNGGFIGFRKSTQCESFFETFKEYFNIVLANQDLLRVKDQAALAAAIKVANPKMKVLPSTYNYQDMWKKLYEELEEPIKVLHCTYAYRPQYAKNVTRSLYTRTFDLFAKLLLPTNLFKNPWRSEKAFLEKPLT